MSKRVQPIGENSGILEGPMSKPPSKRLPGESGIVKAVREHREKVEKFMTQCAADVQGYTAGVTEQLMFQVGQLMTVQAAIIEYLQELSVRRRDDVFAETRIEAIVTQNIAKAKAERAEREAAKKAIDEAARQVALAGGSPDLAVVDGITRTGPNMQPVGDHADLTKACTCVPRDPRAYADDPGGAFDCQHHGHAAVFGPPANIEPASPADEAPAQPVGDA